MPKYAGLNTHQRAVDAGDSIAGVTVHFVTSELDGGPPILQASVPIVDDDDADSLAQRVLVQEHIIYPKVIGWFVDGRLSLNHGKAVLDDEELSVSGISEPTDNEQSLV